MKRILLTITIFLSVASAFAQPFRYTETVFSEVDTLKNIEYASADWLDNLLPLILGDYNVHNGENKTENRPLYMDMFMPKGDTVSKRPVILFGHSGGFLIGSRHNSDMIAFCDSFARRGYVTATIDYRLGMGARMTIIPLRVYVNEENGTRAVYRAVQDSRAAVRFLKHNAEQFRIDTTKIYMAGSSAGAFVALHNLYMDKPHEIPELAMNDPSLAGLDTVGIQGYGSQADAVISMWGALQTPELIEDETKPVLLIHGTNDDVVYFKKGMPLASVVPDYNEVSFVVPETYGSYCIDTALNNRNVAHETYFVPDRGHEFYGVDTGEWKEDGPNEYWDTVHWRISSFLFDIFRPEAEFETESRGITLNCFDLTAGSTRSEWDFGDGSLGSGAEVSHTYADAGTYRVKLTTCNQNMACDTLSKSVTVGGVVAINNPVSQDLKIYPNPASDHLSVSGIVPGFGYEIYDLFGRKHASESRTHSNRIKIHSLPTGMYLLKIETGGKVAIRKFRKIQ